ncbi:MAG: peroxiredoxin-like family protein [Caulobacteraceae bacterium]
MTAQTESLRQLLGDLHAERVRTWDPAVLQVSIDQRKTLVRDSDYAGFVKTGDRLDSFTLTEVDRGPLDIDTLLKAGPVVLVFFRFATCPACNIALPYYNRQLAPRLASLGATLIAVSPQDPARLKDIKDRQGLDFLVASDGNALSRRLGILYTFDEASKAAALAKGTFIGDVTGTGTWELPMPTVVVIGQDRVVRFADVSPDWMVRTEAEPVIAAVEALESVPA